jgi:hypothetical protein
MRKRHGKDKDELEDATALLPGPNSEVDDFSNYSEGDALDKKTIATVIFKSESCIVFVDKALNLAWLINSSYGDDPKDFGAVMGRVDLLLSTPGDLLTPSQRGAFQRLIGGAIARLLDDKVGNNANSILDKAEAYLKTRTTERARIWFLSSAFLVSAFVLLFEALLVVFREAIQQRVGMTAFEIALAVPMGALGASLSMALRITKLDIDAMAGKGVHYFEGAVRVIAGMTGALFVALCVKANILLGTLNATDKRLPFLLILGGFAGASERLVPNMIRKVEGTLIVEGPERK